MPKTSKFTKNLVIFFILAKCPQFIFFKFIEILKKNVKKKKKIKQNSFFFSKQQKLLVNPYKHGDEQNQIKNFPNIFFQNLKNNFDAMLKDTIFLTKIKKS